MKSTEIYDPTTDTWIAGPDMGTTRKEHSAVLLDDGRVMVIGGMVNGSMSKNTEIYDPATNSWSQGTNLPTLRYIMAAATAKDGRVYVMGGFDPNYMPLTSVVVYDSETDSWSNGPTMNVGRLALTSSALLNGKAIIIAGGAGNSGPLNSTEVMEPSMRTYRPKASTPSNAVAKGTKITLTSKTQGAVIYYTTDGSIPTNSSTVYSEPIEINQTMTLKAIAIKENWIDSSLMSETYAVTNVNPTILDDTKTTIVNSPVSGIASGMDADGDTLTYSKNSDPTNGTVDVQADGTWTYTPNNQFTGNDSFTIIVNDGNGGTAIATIAISIIDAVDAKTPIISSQPTGATVNEGETSPALTVEASVTDGGTLSYQWYSNSNNSNIGGTLIPEATNATFNAPTSTIGTKYYYVVVTNTNNGATGTKTKIVPSNAVGVTVNVVPKYTITYNGNSNTSGTVPIDNNAYHNGATITVLGNTGNLVKSGYTFDGWNMAANGSGTNYAVGSNFQIGTANVTLYARWKVAQSSGGGGGSTPTTQQITVNVKSGNSGVTVSQTTINRT